MSNYDRCILDAERILLNNARGEVGDFCLGSVLVEGQLGADAAYGKKLILYRLRRVFGNTVECGVDGCESRFDIESAAQVAGECALKNVCLEAAWLDSEDGGAMEELNANGNFVYDACNAGHNCKSPGCDFSAGFSIGGAPGTAGSCAKKS